MKKHVGLIGLGRMGNNMVLNLLSKKYKVVVYNRSPEPAKKMSRRGAISSHSLEEFSGKLPKPRVIIMMVTAGKPVSMVIKSLIPLLSKGDTVIDGGNSPYKESMKRADEFESTGINFVDVGVSGGPAGAREGACMMVGGNKDDFEALEPLFRDLAAPDAYRYMGTHGAGHFVKMVHNGIEYGMMQAIAEGFAVMEKSGFDLDLQKISDLYNHRSVVESRLVEWLKEGFEKFGQEMEGVSGAVEASGEGEWTVEAAKDLGVPVRVIEDALRFRDESRGNPSYTGKLLQAMRNRFGGHKPEKQ